MILIKLIIIAEEVNQNTNFSDYALEVNSKFNDIII